MKSQKTILLIDANADAAETQTQVLESAGFTVCYAEDGKSAKEMVEHTKPDLIVLELMLPDMDGLVLYLTLREIVDTPIVICSGTRRKRDSILSLKLGAEDFIEKPFNNEEFVARIEKVLRQREALQREEATARIVLGNLEITRTLVRLDGAPLRLTGTEFKILTALAARPGEIFSRDELSQMLWGQPLPSDSRAIDMHIRRTRAKIGWKSGTPAIELARGLGYKLVPPD